MADPNARTCPECGHIEEGSRAAMRMGAHRRSKHGVVGATHGRDRPKDRAPKRKATGAPKPPSLASDLRRTFKMLGTVVSVADPYCGKVLIDRSGPTADALARLAAEDPRVARWLRTIGKAGPYGALVIAVGELALPIAAHHGLIAPELAVLTGSPVPPSRPARPKPGDLGKLMTDPNGHEPASEGAPEWSQPPRG